MRPIFAILIYLLLPFFLFFSTPFTASSQNNGLFPKKKPSEKDRVIKIQRLLRANAWLKKFSGVVLISKDGVPLHKYPAGYANFDYNIQNSITAKYNLCDISHTFTALAIMQLAEEGKLDLKASLVDYLGDLFTSEISQKITLHHLLTHTAGILDYYDLPDYINNFLKIKRLEDLTDIIARQPIQFEPGTQFQRSSSHYVLLASIIEKVSGQDYKTYIEKNIIEKANLETTGLYHWKESVFNRAVGYEFDEEGSPKKMAEFWGAFPFGSDGIYTTIEDLLLFSEVFQSDRLLSQEYKDLMLTPMVYADSSDRSEAYGYGWKTKEQYGEKVIFQEGYVGSLSTAFRIYPKSGYTIVVFSNYYTDIAEDIAEYIEEALFNDDYVVPNHPLAYYFYGLIENRGIDFVTSNFEYILESNQYEIDRVWTLNALGRDLFNEGRPAAALEIYKINARFFPKEPIVYENLGEYFYLQKEYDLALASYQKKLTLLPNNRRASQMLEVIKDDRQRAIKKNEYTPVASIDFDAFLGKRKQAVKPPPKEEEEVAIVAPPKKEDKKNEPLKAVNNSSPKKDLNTSKTTPITVIPIIEEEPKSDTQAIVLEEIIDENNTKSKKPSDKKSTPDLIPMENNQAPYSTPIGELIPLEEEITNINKKPEQEPQQALTAPQPDNAPTNLSNFLEERKSNTADNQLYTVVDKMPMFGKTQADIYKYLTDNLQYPEVAFIEGLEGTVLVNFVVNKDGFVSNIRIKKSLSRGIASCDNEALRLVRIMPKWTPGYEGDKPVKVLYTLPIEFKITPELTKKRQKNGN